jgi:hypothetical protein
MIAAHALSASLILVSHDEAFSFIDGLKTEDWTTPARYPEHGSWRQTWRQEAAPTLNGGAIDLFCRELCMQVKRYCSFYL